MAPSELHISFPNHLCCPRWTSSPRAAAGRRTRGRTASAASGRASGRWRCRWRRRAAARLQDWQTDALLKPLKLSDLLTRGTFDVNRTETFRSLNRNSYSESAGKTAFSSSSCFASCSLITSEREQAGAAGAAEPHGLWQWQQVDTWLLLLTRVIRVLGSCCWGYDDLRFLWFSQQQTNSFRLNHCLYLMLHMFKCIFIVFTNFVLYILLFYLCLCEVGFFLHHIHILF